MSGTVTNITIAGLGGQGVLKASDILAEAAFACGWDVKKAEIHGMSQRGGSVASDVRFSADGATVASPMIPAGQGDYLVVLREDQIEVNRLCLRDGGVLIAPDAIDASALPHPRSLNVALLGVLSTNLPIDEAHWLAALRANLTEKVHELNEHAFAMGREAAAG